MELLGHTFVDTFMHIFSGDPRRAQINDAWKTFFSLMCFWMAHGYLVRNTPKRQKLFLTAFPPLLSLSSTRARPTSEAQDRGEKGRKIKS